MFKAKTGSGNRVYLALAEFVLRAEPLKEMAPSSIGLSRFLRD